MLKVRSESGGSLREPLPGYQGSSTRDTYPQFPQEIAAGTFSSLTTWSYATNQRTYLRFVAKTESTCTGLRYRLTP